MSTTEPPREGLGAPQPVPVFRGSQAACLEYALVLEAKGVPYERVESDGAWLLVVASPLAQAAADELTRYAAERAVRREAPAPFVPFTGSAMGAAVYAFVLILVAYCAGIELFGGVPAAWSARDAPVFVFCYPARRPTSSICWCRPWGIGRSELRRRYSRR